MSETLILPSPRAIEETDTDGPLLVLPAADPVEALLALARVHLQMEVAMVSEFRGEQQIIRHLEGDPEAFDLRIGAGARLSDTYCWRVADRELPAVIPNARSDVRVRDLEATWDLDIGSYVGAPVRFSDGYVYGSVCCLSHSANPSLRDHDAEFMDMLAILIGQEIEAGWTAQEKRSGTVGRIREILERGGLGVAFDPIFDLDSLAIVGYEALPRFQGGGSPARWFADADEIGLGADLERAATQVSLSHLGDLPPGSYRWVSLTPRAIASSKIRDMLAEVPGDRIIVGLVPTEPGCGSSVEAATRDLRSRGLRLAIDHVDGSTLSDICRLQPDVLRLDGDTVRWIGSDPSQRDVVSFLARLGSEVGAVIVADGIETRQTLQVLRDLGVAYGQGYALAPPLSLDDLAPSRRRAHEPP